VQQGFINLSIYPKSFFQQINTPVEDPKLIFVLMPFADKFKEIYEDIIKPLAEEMGLKCNRADQVFSAGPIMEDILKMIATARIVVADVTTRNPNVFYELGISHTVKSDVIIITQSMDDVPFDLRHLRCILYSNTLRGGQNLKSSLQSTIEAILHLEHFHLDKKRRTITYQGKTERLTKHKGLIMELLQKETTVSHKEITSKIQSKTRSANPAEVTRPLISRLNSKLSKLWGNRISIESVRGIGYYLEIR
jgi:DNA-binding winged helix-turn-helix (wHTH) protein